MNPGDVSYHQPEKDAVRQRVIAHAVESLTVERASSPVVTAQEFDRTMDGSDRRIMYESNAVYTDH